MEVDIIFLLVLVSGAVVPGDLFSTEIYTRDQYFDHHIDSCLERLKSIDKPISIFMDILDPKPYNISQPSAAQIVFHGLPSIRRSYNSSETKRTWFQDDTDLKVTFKFSNISGIAHFRGNDQVMNGSDVYFNGTPSEVEVFFMLTRDNTRKRVSFQFVKKPHYAHKTHPFAIDKLLEEKAPTAFNILFEYLYNILYSRILLQSYYYDPYFDNIIDGIISKQSSYPFIRRYTSTEYISHGNASEPYQVSKGSLNLTVDGIRNSFNRTEQVKFQDELNGGLELVVNFRIGDISGSGNVSGYVSNKTDNANFEDDFNFTLSHNYLTTRFYLPRNESFKAMTFSIRDKPHYKMQVRREDLRHSIEKVIDYHCTEIYDILLNKMLKDMHLKVFTNLKNL